MVQPSVGGSPAGKKAGQQRTISKRPPLSRCTTEGHPITKLRTPLFGDGIPSHMPPPLRRRRGNTQPCCNLMGMADIPTPRRDAQFITRTQLPVHRMPSAICSSRTTADGDRSQTFDSLPKARSLRLSLAAIPYPMACMPAHMKRHRELAAFTHRHAHGRHMASRLPRPTHQMLTGRSRCRQGSRALLVTRIMLKWWSISHV